MRFFFFFQAEDGIRDGRVTGVQTCALPISEDGDSDLADVVPDESATSPCDAAAQAVLPREIVKHLEPLNPRERKVIVLRAGLDRGEPRTLGEVGEFFALTRERIRQIEG